jgi:hypothetical protein
MFFLQSVALLLAFTNPLAFSTIYRGTQSHIEEPREVVIRTAGEWSELWKAHAPAAPVPIVNFRREMVVGVFLGTRPTGGYSVEVATIEPKGSETVVTYRVEEPGRDAMVTQALTSPVHLVRLSTRTGDVRFERVGRLKPLSQPH